MLYTIQDVHQLDTPALVIYPELVRENIRLLKEMIDDPQRLRPHVKTHKTREATLLQLEAGIRKFKCATIAEAEMLGSCSSPGDTNVPLDVLLAYQPVGPKVLRFLKLVRQFPNTVFSCLIDNEFTAQQLSAAFSAAGITVPVFIDLDVGQHRTGIPPGHKAIALYEQCASLPGLQVKGLHAYDGHIKEKDIAARTIICDEAYRPVEEMQAALIQKGFFPVIIAGGSPTFPIHAKRPDIECSPGTFVFWDKGYSEYCPEQPFRPAALVITRVISLPGPTRLCLDLGHKAVAAENELRNRISFINAPELVAVGQSEEHLVVEAGEGHAYQIGDVLFGLPVHICPTVALHEKAFTVEQEKLTGTWNIVARNRTITI